MKPWNELTERGKFRRLRQLANTALDEYAITPTALRFVGGFTNAIFRVETPDQTYALRVDYMQDHSDTDTTIELEWLLALGETDLNVARPIPTKAGSPFTFAEAEGIPGARRCVLFAWIPGRPLADHLNETNYHRLGQLSARLHQHGATHRPTTQPMAWDQVFYWPEEVDPVVHDLPRYAHHFPKRRRDILDHSIAQVTPAFAALDPATAQIIHGDLHPWNVHVSRGRLIALDFEDVAWGRPVQDVAITLFYERDNPNYADLRSAFTDGYTSVLAWPETSDGQIEHFMAARTIMFVNFVLNIEDEPGGYFDIAFPRLEAFLKAWA